MIIHTTAFDFTEIIILLFSLLFAFFIIFIENDIYFSTMQILVWLNTFQTIAILIYCIRNNQLGSKFAFFIFNIAYFILLQGAYLCNVYNESFFGIHVFTNAVSISYLNEAKGLLSILLSQFVVFFVYALYNKNRNMIPNSTPTDGNMEKYSKWSLVFMTLGGIAAFIKTGLKVIYVFMYGYLGTYVASGNALYQNPVIDLFDKFYLLGFYGFLATFPTGKKLKIPMTIFIIYSFLNLMTGARGGAVINILFIIWYLSKRNDVLQIKRHYLSMKKCFLLAVAAFIAFPLLYDYGITRVGGTVADIGALDKILIFIQGQGGSGKLTALGLEYSENIYTYISSIMIVFAPIRSFLINNSIARIFTGGSLGQSVETLYKTGGFADVLTYVTNPSSYLNGSGIGTSYVAELTVAFGYVGVIAFSIFLGFILYYIDHLKFDNWITNVIFLNLFVSITYIPRHSTMGFIPESASAVVFILIIMFISGKIKLGSSNGQKI